MRARRLESQLGEEPYGRKEVKVLFCSPRCFGRLSNKGLKREGGLQLPAPCAVTLHPEVVVRLPLSR